MDAIIKVENLKKYFKEVKAVDDISFSVERGELFGFLGVNGAGKSTTINMMCTLFRPTAGEIVIDGCLAGKEDAQIRKRIGVVWQNNCLDDKLTVKENLYVRGALFGEKRNSFREHVTELCERLQLQDVWSRRYENLSGGQKRRCEIAAALLNRPEVLFLDEPTTGLDPATRRLVWESIDQMRIQNQMTVFLTTHYMEEAARAQHIAIMDSGKIKEVGTPFDLKEKYAEDTLRLIPMQDKERELTEALQGHSYQKVQEAYHLQVAKSMDALPVLAKAKPYINGFEMIQGTMDDVFLNITGKTLGAGSGEGL